MRIVRSRLLRVLLFCIAPGLVGHAEEPVQPPFDRLVLIAPAVQGSGWDELARSMARILEQSKLVGSVRVEDVPGNRGAVGLQRLVDQHRGDGNVLLVGGRTLLQSDQTASLLTATIPIARLTGEFEVLAFPAGSDVQSMDSLVTALEAKPRKLPRVTLKSLDTQGMDFSMANWRGVFAPPALTSGQTATLSLLVQALERTPAWKAELERLHWTDLYLSGDEFSGFIVQSHHLVPGQANRSASADSTKSFAWLAQVWLLRNRVWLAIGLLVLATATVSVVFFQRKRAARREEALKSQLQVSREDAEHRKEESEQLRQGISEQIDRQLNSWGLTEAEQEVALLILKGLRHKEIAELRGTSERTVRQQAMTLYKKAGIGGRTDLAAFFLEDILQPLTFSKQLR
jgi:tripartite-type tricarboxylate transporter receptor subunit TctC/DNA-binding CsgD family transcriptional regulator